MTMSEAGKLGAIASAETNMRLKQERIDHYNNDPILCKQCKFPISYEKRANVFCCHSCAIVYNNIVKATNNITLI